MGCLEDWRIIECEDGVGVGADWALPFCLLYVLNGTEGKPKPGVETVEGVNTGVWAKTKEWPTYNRMKFFFGVNVADFDVRRRRG